MRLNLFGRLLLSMLMLVGLLGLLIFAFLASYYTRELEHSLISAHMEKVAIVAKTFETNYRAGKWPFEILKQISKQKEHPAFTWIVNPGGKIVVADNVSLWGKQIKDPTLGAEKPIVEKRFYPEMNEEMLLIVYPLDIKEEGRSWMLYHGVSLKPIAAVKKKINLTSMGFLLGALCLASVFSVFLAKRITKPLLELTKGTKAVAEGNLDYRIKVTTRDELGLLANSFNRMVAELKVLKNKLKGYSKLLERKVRQRTKQLEKSEKAAYNMMEDLNAANIQIEEEKRSIEQKVRERTLDLQKAYEELKALDKNKEEFISMISHELKTPLFPIMGYIDMVLEGSMGRLAPQQKEKLGIVAKSAANLNRLVNDMLDMSKLELKKIKLSMEKNNIIEIAKESTDGLVFMARNKKLDLKLDTIKQLEVYCDHKRIVQVIENLLTNAIKFTKPGGHIVVSVTRDKSNAIVSVKDDGIGISKEDQKLLFSRFFQVKKGIGREYGGGTGLGLAISKGIIDLHKGKIWVESEHGKGSRFIFTLPLGKERLKKP